MHSPPKHPPYFAQNATSFFVLGGEDPPFRVPVKGSRPDASAHQMAISPRWACWQSWCWPPPTPNPTSPNPPQVRSRPRHPKRRRLQNRHARGPSSPPPLPAPALANTPTPPPPTPRGKMHSPFGPQLAAGAPLRLEFGLRVARGGCF